MIKELKQLLENCLQKDDTANREDVEIALQKAYDMGKASKKCKEDNDNPYHIDYKRQTKLDL